MLKTKPAWSPESRRAAERRARARQKAFKIAVVAVCAAAGVLTVIAFRTI